jgi:hypothetical protein
MAEAGVPGYEIRGWNGIFAVKIRLIPQVRHGAQGQDHPRKRHPARPLKCAAKSLTWSSRALSSNRAGSRSDGCQPGSARTQSEGESTGVGGGTWVISTAISFSTGLIQNKVRQTPPHLKLLSEPETKLKSRTGAESLLSSAVPSNQGQIGCPLGNEFVLIKCTVSGAKFHAVEFSANEQLLAS